MSSHHLQALQCKVYDSPGPEDYGTLRNCNIEELLKVTDFFWCGIWVPQSRKFLKVTFPQCPIVPNPKFLYTKSIVYVVKVYDSLRTMEHWRTAILRNSSVTDFIWCGIWVPQSRKFLKVTFPQSMSHCPKQSNISVHKRYLPCLDLIENMIQK